MEIACEFKIPHCLAQSFLCFSENGQNIFNKCCKHSTYYTLNGMVHEKRQRGRPVEAPRGISPQLYVLASPPPLFPPKISNVLKLHLISVGAFSILKNGIFSHTSHAYYTFLAPKFPFPTPNPSGHEVEVQR